MHPCFRYFIVGVVLHEEEVTFVYVCHYQYVPLDVAIDESLLNKAVHKHEPDFGDEGKDLLDVSRRLLVHFCKVLLNSFL